MQAVDLIACDGVSILNPPVDGPAPDLTSFVLMGTLAGVVLAIAGTVGWGVKTGRISMDRIMQTLFDEHICIITDMLFNFGAPVHLWMTCMLQNSALRSG